MVGTVHFKFLAVEMTVLSPTAQARRAGKARARGHEKDSRPRPQAQPLTVHTPRWALTSVPALGRALPAALPPAQAFAICPPAALYLLQRLLVLLALEQRHVSLPAPTSVPVHRLWEH